MTQAELSIPPRVIERCCCPACRAPLRREGDGFACSDAACAETFRVFEGIPLLISAAKSIFDPDGIIEARQAERRSTPGSLSRFAQRYGPRISKNIRSRGNYRRFAELLRERSERPLILIVGGGLVGQGLDTILHDPAFDFVASDVYLSDETVIVCDCHDLPFQDGGFDAVIVQAVLEHVIDPFRCVAEIHRVLKDNGLVYAETAFMQPVHAGRYDFLRFTPLAHRRLFREFEEVWSGRGHGAGYGPCMDVSGIPAELLPLAPRVDDDEVLRARDRLLAEVLRPFAGGRAGRTGRRFAGGVSRTPIAGAPYRPRPAGTVPRRPARDQDACVGLPSLLPYEHLRAASLLAGQTGRRPRISRGLRDSDATAE